MWETVMKIVLCWLKKFKNQSNTLQEAADALDDGFRLTVDDGRPSKVTPYFVTLFHNGDQIGLLSWGEKHLQEDVLSQTKLI